MKRYIAIGHWEENENMTSVAMLHHSMKEFKGDCRANGFIPWVILTEKRMAKMKQMDSFEMFEEVCKMTSNYRKWNDITDYIDDCFYIMEERMEKAE